MEYKSNDYTKHYIVEALFKLMHEYEYEKINVKDIAYKAGVGRATFYRYFKNKEEVIEYYFNHNTNEFISEQKYIPRCKEDYVEIVTDVFERLQKNKECFYLLRKAHLEYLYLDFLNKKMVENFHDNYKDKNPYQPYLYAGMIFNISMAYLDRGCSDSIMSIANLLIDSLNMNE